MRKAVKKEDGALLRPPKRLGRRGSRPPGKPAAGRDAARATGCSRLRPLALDG
jgi:hypothetical protein